MSLTQDLAKSALEAIVDPVTQKPLGALGMLKRVDVAGTTVHAEIELFSHASSGREAIEAEAERVLTQAGATSVELTFSANVRTRQVTGEDPCPDVKNVILVMSGKGGVGKSTVAANLTLALHRAGARVGILDADIYGPSVPTMLGVQGRPVSADGKSIEPLERFGVKIMSIGFLLDDPKTAVVWRGPMLHGALQQFLQDVHWGKLDYLILDLPPGTGDVALTLSQKIKVTGAVIVTTPQEVALMDVYKSISMCQKLNIPILGVVENMSYFMDPSGNRNEIFGRGGGEKAAEFAKAPLLAQIPMDSLVREWGDNGTPVVQAQPTSTVAKAFKELAERLSDKITLALNESYGGVAPTEGPKRLKILR
ncbi:MAG: Mrp/NBP35 family ATP-binding protein [Deltaproteobacteria bacterium]|nr:Mrp/NBP35 family ATP-binding protein [Deltaproteobacteria bacterium]